MGRAVADAVAADFAASLMAGFDKVADERLAQKVEALSERIIEHLPEVVYLPPPPAEVPEERLLSVKEVARLLGCSPRTVQMRMDRGELVYVLERGSENRKVLYSWAVEYLKAETMLKVIGGKDGAIIAFSSNPSHRSSASSTRR